MLRWLQNPRLTSLLLVAVLAAVLPLRGGVRGPGKYSGVIIFDRWDTCFLLSGPFITYISNSVKDGLRPYAGQAVQIDALEVIQHGNPGDALVRNYVLLGPAPEPKQTMLRGLALQTSPSFHAGAAIFDIEIRNTVGTQVWVRTDQIGITVVGSVKRVFSPSDGASEAVITRSPLSLAGGGEEIWRADDGRMLHASYTVNRRVPDRVLLKPESSFQAKITLNISPGDYEILFGYGGGVHEEASMASNAVSFTVEPSGLTTLNAR